MNDTGYFGEYSFPSERAAKDFEAKCLEHPIGARVERTGNRVRVHLYAVRDRTEYRTMMYIFVEENEKFLTDEGIFHSN